MKEKKYRALTSGEMEVMNILWDNNRSLTINEMLDLFPDPKPAYTTIATFLKLIEAKGYVEHYKIPGQRRTFHFSPMLTREKYISLVLDEVKGSLFGNSAKKLFSFLVQTEELSEDELLELLQMVRLSSNADPATEQ